MGLPVITTLQNGACEVMEDGKQGLLLERGDPAAIAAALRRMLDGERLAVMSREALALRAKLSYEHHVAKIEAVYREVLAQRGGERVGAARE